ncbi:MAG: AraC family transcriptional regulator [Ruminococcaceae bacterium]|jgi:predicted transcriptional regulator|nr:AraC family transcriptional regulator [Oscillospiraceae bacterium]
MNLTELSARLGLETVSGSTEGREWRGVYAGDLLSRAMSHVKADNLWITIMPNANVVAVASLTEAAAVILAEGVELLPDALDAAEDNGIIVLSSKHTVFELCAAIYEASRGRA